MYIDDIFMAAETQLQAQFQLNCVRGVLNRYYIPYDGHDTAPLSKFVYLGIEYYLTT